MIMVEKIKGKFKEVPVNQLRWRCEPETQRRDEGIDALNRRKK